jgi:RNA polymerase sigma factor (sigma-70 family)
VTEGSLVACVGMSAMLPDAGDPYAANCGTRAYGGRRRRPGHTVVRGQALGGRAADNLSDGDFSATVVPFLRRRSDPRCGRPRRGRDPLALGEAFPEVLAAARRGASPAFERLYADLAPAVAGYLRVQRAAEPEDLTSEVFLGVFRGLGTFDGTEKQFRSWVFTIAHRRLQDERRRLSRQPNVTEVEQETTLSAGDVEREALEALGEQWVIGLCGRLSADQRTVLLLRVVADLTVEEVARITGKSVGAVKALQRRGLDALRKKLAREGVSL